VHRDFTPDNLILGDDGILKLVDFNVAQQSLENNVTGSIVGKQCYIPIEQIRGQANPQSDIYALGATLHFLLTGHDPEPLSVSHPQQINLGVSDSLDVIVAKATEIECEQRIQNVSEIRALLEEGCTISLADKQSTIA